MIPGGFDDGGLRRQLLSMLRLEVLPFGVRIGALGEGDGGCIEEYHRILMVAARDSEAVADPPPRVC